MPEDGGVGLVIEGWSARVLLWLHDRTDISNNIYVGNPVQFVIDVQAMQAADQTLWKSSAAQRFGTWTAYAVLRMGPQAKDRGPKDSLKEECLPGAWQAPTALLHRVDSPRALRILQILRHRQRLQEAASREKQQREEEGELMPAAPQYKEYKVKRQKKKAKERV